MQLQVGAHIRAARQKQRLKQFEVAEKLGLSPAAYQRIEAGITDITLSRIEEIAQILHTNTGELLGLTLSPTIPKATELPPAVYLLVPMKAGTSTEILQSIQQLINKLT